MQLAAMLRREAAKDNGNRESLALELEGTSAGYK